MEEGNPQTFQKEARARNISYHVPVPENITRIPGAQPDGTDVRLKWDGEKRRWFRYETSYSIEPEWGQAQAGERTSRDSGPHPLDVNDSQKLLSTYRVDPNLVSGLDVGLFSPDLLERIADTAKK